MNIDMKGYTATIGLEIHAHLKTKTKMFSKSPNNPDEERANQNISPVDLAHPGTLPTINKKAIEHMIRIGLAVDGDIANFTEFDRKNYFYPDIPKGYQISQYKYPIVSNGTLAGFDLERIHLEEDTATSKHFDKHTLVDFNRAGAPLMELVTRPVLHTPDDVIKFARELQLLLRYLGAGDANIEKGQMRVEVNISVSKTDELGTKVEVKNIGSIASAGKAVEFETVRQIAALENGEELFQETRGWDDNRNITVIQRSKENAKDYRYFPEPDLPKLYLHEIFDIEKMRGELPELASGKRTRYASDFNIKDEDIEFYINNRDYAEFFEAVISEFEENSDDYKKCITSSTNVITSNLVGIAKEHKGKNVFEKLYDVAFAELI
ncbi:MAG: Asp-tRNA(Asn)/Glu-tRNA(Gln) amidotransferase subunit GatB, partial [Candidatus Pacebacteria bacterium]|nr:Asp-tRNA(Asn)/Glu-tRNA(Gln) amidotransferase subunit GatB [Candidatus Paceibacterota bacterium]